MQLTEKYLKALAKYLEASNVTVIKKIEKYNTEPELEMLNQYLGFAKTKYIKIVGDVLVLLVDENTTYDYIDLNELVVLVNDYKICIIPKHILNRL